MFDHVSKDVGPMAPRAGTRGRERRSSCLILAGAVALAACGEVVPIVPDALSPDNATLASLDLGAFGDLEPAFDPEVTTYRASFSLLVQELNVTATPVHPDATLTINGEGVVPEAFAMATPQPPDFFQNARFLLERPRWRRELPRRDWPAHPPSHHDRACDLLAPDAADGRNGALSRCDAAGSHRPL